MTVKSKTQSLGFAIESEALLFLEKQGLKLLQQNYSCLCGEIDLIMQDKDSVVFVEVRYRKNNNYGSAAETVTYPKQQRIIRTALYFLKQKRWVDKVNCRFDVIGMDGRKQIEWIKDAFSA